MYLLIEHNGTEENTKLASKLRDIAEDDFGATCEYAIGNLSGITLYDDDQDELINFSGPRSDDDLRYILHFVMKEEDEDGI